MITKIKGQLEIDHTRGVIWFHASKPMEYGMTVLRVCCLPKPVPMDRMLDIAAVDAIFNWTDQRRVKTGK